MMIMVTNLLDVAKTSVLLPVWAHDNGRGVASIGLMMTCMAGCSMISSLVASWKAIGCRGADLLVAFAIAGPPRSSC